MRARKIDYAQVPWKPIADGRIKYKPVKMDDFGTSEVAFTKGVNEPAHSHPEGQIVFCLSGRIEFRLTEGGEEHRETLMPGDMLAIPAGVVHGAHAIDETRLYVCWSPMRRFDADAVIV